MVPVQCSRGWSNQQTLGHTIQQTWHIIQCLLIKEHGFRLIIVHVRVQKTVFSIPIFFKTRISVRGTRKRCVWRESIIDSSSFCCFPYICSRRRLCKGKKGN
ncbi:hypothetical protein V8G54_023010 [Vigna mungo]|uniref:Uncharacterized protein n=1 Tax=Vigna mungo TaxID=3915 RepID=A0AAQ3N3G2_VIGMU